MRIGLYLLQVRTGRELHDGDACRRMEPGRDPTPRGDVPLDPPCGVCGRPVLRSDPMARSKSGRCCHEACAAGREGR